jgi:hypothetical protein
MPVKPCHARVEVYAMADVRGQAHKTWWPGQLFLDLGLDLNLDVGRHCYLGS